MVGGQRPRLIGVNPMLLNWLMPNYFCDGHGRFRQLISWRAFEGFVARLSQPRWLRILVLLELIRWIVPCYSCRSSPSGPTPYEFRKRASRIKRASPSRLVASLGKHGPRSFILAPPNLRRAQSSGRSAFPVTQSLHHK